VRFTCPTATCEIGAGAAGLRSPFPGFCDLGSVNLPALAGLAAAISWQEQRGAASRERPVALARRLRDALVERPGCRVLGGDGPRTATVSLLLDRLPLAEAQGRFAARGVEVRAGTHCAPMALDALGAPDGCVRVSFGPHNVDADVDAVLAAVDAVA
jgi:selenocysteine lyase/cysteine desulfurase